ncbi:thioesterase II family protein [Streptomyces griseorubiginosus]|uniref:thioesterase II family protein n=1 Tax=Streptomyces griseorubiginosus TaxID=67304 RepID=UPI0036AF0887
MTVSASEERRWFKRFQRREGASVQLLCFHHAGGSAAMFREWTNLLPRSVEVIAVQLPGRADRFIETPYHDMTPLVDQLVEVIGPILERPYACYGASMGARVSWSLAHVLRERELPMPRKLYVSSSAAPSLDRQIRGWNGPDEGLVRYMRELGGTPSQVLDNPDLLEGVLPILRADLTVLSTHTFQPTAPLDVPIRAFAGASDAEVPPAQMATWSDETNAEFTLDIVESGHFLDVFGLRQVIEAIGKDLD